MSDIQKKLEEVTDHDAWRDRLLKSLRQCGAQPAPRFIFLRYVMAIFFCILLGAIGIGSRLATDVAAREGAPALVIFACSALLSLFSIAVLSRIRNYLLRTAWRSSARNALRELEQVGSRRPVFYLRSFSVDKFVDRPTWLERYLGTFPFATVEQRVTANLRKVGPVIAIGRPGEKLPQLGAARFYVPNELWQAKVAEVVRESSMVVWMSGVTAGLGWELSHLRDNINPRRLMLWAHPHLLGGSEAAREEEWRKFRNLLGKYFPKPLPEKLGDARFFVFDEEWNPIPCPPRMSAPFTVLNLSALKRALHLRQNGCDAQEAEILSDLSQNRKCQYLGDVIGARRPERDWPRLVGFAVAMLVASAVPSIVNRLIDSQEIYWSSLFYSEGLFLVLQAAALAIAYRFLPLSFAAVPAASAATAAANFLAQRGNFIGGFCDSLLNLACLAFTVARSARLAVGLFLGKLIGGLLAIPTLNVYFNFIRLRTNYAEAPFLEVLQMVFADMGYRPWKWVVQAFAEAVLFTLVFSLVLILVPTNRKKAD